MYSCQVRILTPFQQQLAGFRRDNFLVEFSRDQWSLYEICRGFHRKIDLQLNNKNILLLNCRFTFRSITLLTNVTDSFAEIILLTKSRDVTAFWVLCSNGSLSQNPGFGHRVARILWSNYSPNQFQFITKKFLQIS